MAAVTIDVTCEVTDPRPGEPESVREALAAELGVIVEDLALDADYRVDVWTSPAERAKGDSGPRLRLHLDGVPLPPDHRSAPEAIRAHLVELVTPRLLDHLWERWGGRSVAPPAFRHLVRDLVRHRVRPDRVAHAVPTWPERDPLRLFEDALLQVSRRIPVHVNPERAPELAGTFALEKGAAWPMMVDGLFYELGLLVGECAVTVDPSVPADTFCVRINDLRSRPMPLLRAGECAVNDTVDRLTLLNIKGQEAVNPANGSECALIPKESAPVAEGAGLTTWDTGGWAILGTSAELRRAAAALLDLDAVHSLLEKLDAAFPYLVAWVKEQLGVEAFARVLRRLVDEEISIRNLRHVIQGLSTMSPPPIAPIDLSRFIVFAGTYSGLAVELAPTGRTPDPAVASAAELARVNLKRYVSHKYTRGGNTLVVYLLDPKVERRLANRRRLSRPERRWLLEGVFSEVGNLPPTAQNPCVLTSMELRHRVSCELRPSFPHLAVLSYQELSPDMNIQPIARISPDDPPPKGPLDLVDEALDELRFEDAEERLSQALGHAPPAALAPRLAEVCYFWNEAGRLDRLAGALAAWRALPLEPAAASELEALRRDPDAASVRRWLAARDPLLLRSLRARYLPAVEDLVHVPGGKLSMGEPGATDGDRPPHDVELDDFDVGRTAVTAPQFALFLAVSGRRFTPGSIRGDDAARGVRWREAIEYCGWLSRKHGLDDVYAVEAPAGGAPGAEPGVQANHARGGFRLPTEAEWEFAARGGKASRGLRFAGSDRLADVGDATGADAVATRLPNELGLYDMSGGRAEWCWDWYAPDAYAGAAARNPTGPPQGTTRVCRGGDVLEAGADEACTVYAREPSAPMDPLRSTNVGFRLARTHLEG